MLLKQRSEDPSVGRSSASTGLATGSPSSPSEDTSVVGRAAGTAAGEAEDDHSDKGTYTIELENRNAEEEEARRMIDKVPTANLSSQRLKTRVVSWIFLFFCLLVIVPPPLAAFRSQFFLK